MAKIQAVPVISLHVTDFKRAMRFYEEAFGLKAESVVDEMGWAQYHLPGGQTLGIHTWESACKTSGGRPPGTVTGLILQVDDPHAFAKQVAANGGTVTDPVEKQPWGPVGGTCADPDGNEFLFVEPMLE